MHGMSTVAYQTATIGVNAKISEVIDIRGASRIGVELPVFTQLITATANVTFLISNSPTGTFRPLHAMGVYSGASGIFQYEVPSTAGSIVLDVPPLTGYPYMQVKVSNTATATYAMSVFTIF